MKNLLEISGAQVLSTTEQKQVKGGNGNECYECLPGEPTNSPLGCPPGTFCVVQPDGCHYCSC